MIQSNGRFDSGPFFGKPITAAASDYLCHLAKTAPLSVVEALFIQDELQRRKEQFPGVCPICGHYNYSARNNRFAVGVNRKGRR